MKKINTTPISGMQELLPARQTVFDEMRGEIEQAYRRRGYMHIETPAIERLEILLAKAGGETEKQIYKVMKTAESGEEATEGLRFDHTVPLARYVVENEGKLTFPFKVMQLEQNWRGERAQRGRFREFYQCDVDVIGRGKLPLAYDADVIATMLEAYRGMGLGGKVMARISNRKIVTGFLRALDLEVQAAEIYSIIDHAEKISREEVRYALMEAGLTEATQKRILSFIDLHGKADEILPALHGLKIEDELFTEGLSELTQVLGWLEEEGWGRDVEADMKIVRGLDYYTGTVFEFALWDDRKVGSIGGGGRYENLAENFTEQQFPGVGGSIGLSRLFQVLTDSGYLHNKISGKPLDFAVVPISEKEIAFANKVAHDLRGEGNRVTVAYQDKRLADKLAYAARIANNAIVVGEEEVRTGEYQVKRFN